MKWKVCGAASISNWTGATFDADNVGGSGVNANGSPNNGAANDGTTYVIKASPTFELVARNNINEEINGSISIAHGQVFLRGMKHLYCIGKK